MKTTNSERCRKYRRSFKGLTHRMYLKMKERTAAKDYLPPMEIDYNDFMVLVMSNLSVFGELLRNWKDSNYAFPLTPSVDRIDHKKGYSAQNIQFITKGDNSRKANNEYPRNRKPVLVSKANAELLCESRQEAADFLTTTKYKLRKSIENNTPLKGWMCINA